MKIPDFPYLTLREAQQRLGIGRTQLRRLLEEDRMPRSFRWDFVWCVHEKDVDDYQRTRLRPGQRRGKP